MESFMLNSMCMDCGQLNNGCNGTTNQAWTGCIYKKAPEQSKESVTERRLKLKEYAEAENSAYDALVAAGFTPQGINADFKSVCVMKFEHPEFWDNPVKRGNCIVYRFKDWQEAEKELCPPKGGNDN